MIDSFEKLATSLGDVTSPAHPARPQRMNANAFCVRNRVFAMRVGGDPVLKLPPQRLGALIAAGVAAPNVVGGRAMKEWANLGPVAENEWLGLAKEALEYVRNKR